METLEQRESRLAARRERERRHLFSNYSTCIDNTSLTTIQRGRLREKAFARDTNPFSWSVSIAQARPPMFKHLSSISKTGQHVRQVSISRVNDYRLANI